MVMSAPMAWIAVKDSPRNTTDDTVPNTGTVNMLMVAVTGPTDRNARK